MQCKSGGKKHGKKRHKAYIALQKLSAKTYHTSEKLCAYQKKSELVQNMLMVNHITEEQV